tara:strand:- start:294 stop:542 length:249 start_codon:yes stop_codon:yes gene_type:complete
MKWFLVVIFAGITPDGYQDVYIFHKPNYTSLEQCVEAANDPSQIQVFTQKLVMEYQSMKPIQRVVCSPEDSLRKVVNGEEKA